ncbi:MAG: hypothetical protein JSR72_09040 [Proteobacteria bacterium]|nr:hypothetical protein [Pseudomonadota bacterium]
MKFFSQRDGGVGARPQAHSEARRTQKYFSVDRNVAFDRRAKSPYFIEIFCIGALEVSCCCLLGDARFAAPLLPLTIARLRSAVGMVTHTK